MIYSYPYPHPAVTTDIAVFTLREGRLCLLLIQRAEDPHAGAWALPGGFLNMDETLDDCARRELLEETGVEASVLFPFANFSEPDRDPRERVISAAYLALMPFDRMSPRADSDAAAVRWAPVDDLPPLAFDHADIVKGAIEALRKRCEAFDILFGLLPVRFTLSAFQAAYEAVMGRAADRRNLHKAVLASGLIELTDETARGRHRPARLYSVRSG